MTDLKAYAELVNAMRQAQAHYFRTRSGAALDRAKAAEAKVDAATKDILQQPTLFDGEE